MIRLILNTFQRRYYFRIIRFSQHIQYSTGTELRHLFLLSQQLYNVELVTRYVPFSKVKRTAVIPWPNFFIVLPSFSAHLYTYRISLVCLKTYVHIVPSNKRAMYVAHFKLTLRRRLLCGKYLKNCII